MMKDEKALKGIVERWKPTGFLMSQLDGLMVKIEQLLGRDLANNQNKIMLLQEIV